MDPVQSRISSVYSHKVPEDVAQHLPDFHKEHVFDAIRAGDANRLFSLFDERKLDLTAINEETGGTALHLAISEKNDDILKMLLEMAGDDPEVLNAKDRDGCTPLMRAAVERNAPMMKALVEAGAGVDNHFPTPSELPSISTRSMRVIATSTSAARMLISAKGDLLTAFEIATEKSDANAKDLFFKGGADSSSALQRFASQKKWPAVESLIQHWDDHQTSVEFQYFARHRVLPPFEVRAEQWKNRRAELTGVLDDAVKLEDSEAVSSLVKWDPCGAADELVVRYAVSNDTKGVSTLFNISSDPLQLIRAFQLHTSMITIAEKENLSDSEKKAAIKMIVNLLDVDGLAMRELRPGYLLSHAFDGNKLNAARLMVAAGVPASAEQLINLLMYLGENNQLAGIRALIHSDADIFTAIERVSELRKICVENGDDEVARRSQDALNNLVMMLVDEAPFWTKQVCGPEPQPQPKAESYCAIL